MHVFPFSNLVWDGAAAAFRSVRSSTKQLASSAIALVGVVFEFAQSFKLLEPSIVRASSAASCVARRAPYIELSFSAFSPFQCFHIHAQLYVLPLEWSTESMELAKRYAEALMYIWRRRHMWRCYYIFRSKEMYVLVKNQNERRQNNKKR